MTDRRQTAPGGRTAALLLSLLFVLPLLGGCRGREAAPPGPSPGPAPGVRPPEAGEAPVGRPPSPRREEPPRGGEVPLGEDARGMSPEQWADVVLEGLTLREKVGQMVMPFVLGDFAPVGSEQHGRTRRLVEELGVGGIIVSVGSPTTVAAKMNDLQGHARIPLLVSADFERGAGMRFRGAVFLPHVIDLGGATEFPPNMAVGATGDPAFAYEMGRITGVEARATGVHVAFAPVMDVNNNPDNPIINVRSFGEDPEMVAAMSAAFVRGAQEHGIVATGKHFPGHGDTGTDSHLELPIIRMDRTRLDTLELVPFRESIRRGLGAVMSAHIAIPVLTGGEDVPATLSPGALSGLLREELDFRGLIFTDALDMNAIDERYETGEAAIRSVEAGADVLLMPPDEMAAMNGVIRAVTGGRIPEERIDASVRRLLETKARLGLHLGAGVPVDAVRLQVGTGAHEAVARRIAERSITLLRDGDGLVPLGADTTLRILSVTYRRHRDLMAGRAFDAVLRERYPELATVTVHPDAGEEEYREILDEARSFDVVLVSPYVPVVSYSGSVAAGEAFYDFVGSLAGEGIPHLVTSFGNPYLIRDFPDVHGYMLAWGDALVSQRAAARALTGAIPVRGTTPTRIPPLFEIGDGLRVPPPEGGGGGG